MNQKQQNYFIKRVDQMLNEIGHSYEYPKEVNWKAFKNHVRKIFLDDLKNNRLKFNKISPEDIEFRCYSGKQGEFEVCFRTLFDLSKYNKMRDDFDKKVQAYEEKRYEQIEALRIEAQGIKDKFIFGECKEALKQLQYLEDKIKDLNSIK